MTTICRNVPKIKNQVGKNVWIDAGCIILKGVNIGDNAVVAAGSLITHDVPENKTVIQKRDTIYK